MREGEEKQGERRTREKIESNTRQRERGDLGENFREHFGQEVGRVRRWGRREHSKLSVIFTCACE